MLVLFGGKSRISCRFLHAPLNQGLTGGVRPIVGPPSSPENRPKTKSFPLT